MRKRSLFSSAKWKGSAFVTAKKKKKKKTNSQHWREGIRFRMNLTNQITFHKVGWQFGLPPPSGPYWLDGTIFLHVFIYHWTLQTRSQVPALPWKSLCRGKRGTNMTTQTPGLSRKKVAGDIWSRPQCYFNSCLTWQAGGPHRLNKTRGTKGGCACVQATGIKRRSAALSWTQPPTLPMNSGCDGPVWTLECSGCLFQLSFPINAGLNVWFESLKTWTPSNSLFSVFLHSGEHF